MLTVLRPLVAGATFRRWAYLIVGGALLVPYLLVGAIVLPEVLPVAVRTADQVGLSLLVAVVVAASVALSSFIPAVRVLEGTAVREMLGGRMAELAVGAERTWSARWRAAGWFVLHIAAGGVVSVLTLVVPPMVVVGFTEPFASRLDFFGLRVAGRQGWAGAWVPLAAMVALVGLVYLAAAVGAGLAALAPRCLGPSPAERLAAAERRAAWLAERNRLARELHDSVGHALSVVAIQAGAAGRVLDADREFARRALSAIEDSARDALADLDHVLGLLREDRDDRPPAAPAPTLRELPGLLDRTRLAGVSVESEVVGDLAAIPSVVSRETYRIVQEGLTNALRHAGRVPVRLRIVVGAEELVVGFANPLGAGAVHRSGRGGRGLRGMRERVTVLRGRLTAGAEDGRWRVDVVLPLRAGQGRGES